MKGDAAEVGNGMWKTKKEALEAIRIPSEGGGGLNVMGCCEDWYDPAYVINRTFGDDELDDMPLKELNRMYAALQNMSDGLY